MFDLPEDVIREIFSRVPVTSLSAVRATCKKWNVLSKKQIVGKAAPVRKQFLGFMLMNSRVCSLRLDLQRIYNECKFIEPSVNQISVLNKFDIVRVFHCKGLLLCVLKDRSRFLVWNPYLGQIRWIPLKKKLETETETAFAYRYTLGYDSNNRSHKILSFLCGYDIKTKKHLLFKFEIFDFSSNSWRLLDFNVPDWDFMFYQQGMSLKENTFFVARDKLSGISKNEDFLIGFDYTTERFGPRLPLPFLSYSHVAETVLLSCIRDEQLAVLYKRFDTHGTLGTIEIWVTTKIDLGVVSWSQFLKVDKTQLNGIPGDTDFGSFFINEEKKVAVVFNVVEYELSKSYELAYIIGQNGCIKSVNIGETSDLGKPSIFGHYLPRVCSSYVPSLVQPRIKKRGKRKERV